MNGLCIGSCAIAKEKNSELWIEMNYLAINSFLAHSTRFDKNATTLMGPIQTSQIFYNDFSSSEE